MFNVYRIPPPQPLPYSSYPLNNIATSGFVRIQSTGASSTTALTSQSATFSLNVTSGDMIIVNAVGWDIGASGPVLSVTDSQLNVYTPDVTLSTSYSGISSVTNTIFRAIAASTGSLTVTVSSTLSALISFGAEEYRLPVPGGPVSIIATATGTGSSATPITSNLSLPTNVDLVVAGFDIHSTGLTYTPGSMFTLGYTDNTVATEPLVTEFNLNTFTNPIAPSCGISSSASWNAVAVAYTVNQSIVNIYGVDSGSLLEGFHTKSFSYDSPSATTNEGMEAQHIDADLGQVFNVFEGNTFSNVIANDSFVGTDGTELSSHTPNSGGTWTQHPVFTGSVVLTNANRIRQNSTNITAYLESTIPPYADYAVGCNIYAFTLPLSNTTGFSTGLCARFDPVNVTGYMAVYDPTNKSANWVLNRYNAGTPTQLGVLNQSISTGTEYAVLLTVQGPNVYLSVNGTVILSAVPDSSPILSTGRAGVFFGSVGTAATDSTGVHLDSWQLYDSVFIAYNNETQLITIFDSDLPLGPSSSPLTFILFSDSSPTAIEANFISDLLYDVDISATPSGYMNFIIVCSDTVTGIENQLLISIQGLYSADIASASEGGMTNPLGSDQPIGGEISYIFEYMYQADSSSQSESNLTIIMSVSDAVTGIETQLYTILSTAPVIASTDLGVASEASWMTAMVFGEEIAIETDVRMITNAIFVVDVGTLLD
jgi:hypothetical protein